MTIFLSVLAALIVFFYFRWILALVIGVFWTLRYVFLVLFVGIIGFVLWVAKDCWESNEEVRRQQIEYQRTHAATTVPSPTPSSVLSPQYVVRPDPATGKPTTGTLYPDGRFIPEGVRYVRRTDSETGKSAIGILYPNGTFIPDAGQVWP
jgi:hypothetical protein